VSDNFIKKNIIAAIKIIIIIISLKIFQ